MKKSVENKRDYEKNVVNLMIRLYCKDHHHTDALCNDCQSLSDYASMRVDKCPFMETKTFCSNCKVHCYKKDMREKIKQVMRYSGPRMMLYHPLLAIKHLYYSKKERRQLEKNA